MTLLFIIVPILFYMFAAGAVSSKVRPLIKAKCSHTIDINCYTFLVSIVWPLTIPYLLGFRTQGTSRVERKRDKEIEEAEHKTKLAQIRFEEDQYLTKQLSEK